MEHWLAFFGGSIVAGIPPQRQEEIWRAVAHKLRPQCYRDGGCTLDYRRLRVVAIRDSLPVSGPTALCQQASSDRGNRRAVPPHPIRDSLPVSASTAL